MAIANCWEVKGCGFERASPGKAVCPAVTCETADGFLGGKNGGRACFFIPNTLCGGSGRCSTEDKAERCMDCRFYRDLKDNFGATFNTANFQRFIQNSATRMVV